MALDQTLLGDATVKMMDALEKEGQFENAKFIAVGIVGILERPCEDDEGAETYVRVYSTEDVHHRALGLFSVALDLYENDAVIP